MTALQVIDRLRALDVRLWIEGERLRYEAPNGALTPELVAQVGACRDELVELVRAAQAHAGAAAPTSAAAQRPERFPVSLAQRRLWILERLEAPGATYHVHGAVRLRGRLRPDVLRASMAAIIRRHEVLRTGFEEDGGEPVQVVRGAVEVPLEIAELHPGPGQSWPACALPVLEDALARPFELTRPPLMRALLLRRTPDDHVLGVVMHHLVSDGWSVAVLVEELAAGYAGAVTEPLALQYGDYARATRERLHGPALEREVEHWRRRLAGAPLQLDLPADRPRPPLQSFAGATATRRLPAALGGALRELSAREGVTLFTTLLAGFAVLLHRYTGREGVVVGAPFGGRAGTELEPLIGFFVNTLPLRCDLSGDPSMRALLARTRALVHDALAHDEVPFELLVDALHAPRDPSRQPLVQVLFALNSAPPARLRIPGLRVESLALEGRTAKYDLAVSVEEAGDGGLLVALEYSTDLFDGERIERLARHFERLLEAAVADPAERISQLALIPDDERERLLVTFDERPEPASAAATLGEAFEQQVERTPQAVALRWRDEQLTYAELDARAGELARRLRGLGVGPETLVAVCLARSPDLIVALLAILKAGGAYVALDPSYPPERIAFIVADTRAPVLVTERRLAAGLPAHAGRTLCVDEPHGELGPAPAPRPPLHPDNLAYVIYTSGSTGRPKGVAITHRSAVAMLAWAHTEFSPADLREVLASTSVCFDLSVFEIFAPLTAGTTVVLAGGPLDLLDDPQIGDITLLNTVPSAARVLAWAGTIPRSVRVVCLAGEPLPASLGEAVYECDHVQRLYNLYGPSEDTTYSTAALVARGPGAPTIGRPIAGTRAYVLDGRGQPLPVGVPGELYLGGRGLARGYLARPALTAQRFVPDSFGAPGGRLYRTGDRVRRRADGQLEFLGRIDHQLKIRGYRIEPGEIEVALARHAAVREAVVVARPGEREGELRLVAYVATTAEVRDGELRGHLAACLPAYLVPATFVALDALPLTPTGKIDRAALPDPDADRDDPDPGAESTAPRSEVEATLAAIWSQLLRVPRVGVHDNFFDLGGDSILALQAVARAVRAGLELSPRDLLAHQTVAELAAVARPAGARPAHAPAEPGPLALTPIQRWFFAQELARPDHFNQSLLLELDPSVGAATLAGALSTLVERHPALRTRFMRSTSGWVGEILAGVATIVVEQDLSAAADPVAELERRADELQASLDLAAGRVFVAARFELGDGRPPRLLLVAHHLVVDGVSWRVLLEELELVCRAAARGERAALAPPTVSPRTWAQALEALAQAPATSAEADRWRDALDGVAPIPLDHPGAENREHATRVVSVRLGVDDTRALLTGASRPYRTRPDDLLLTALSVALGRWSGAHKLLVDVERHGRDTLPALDASRTVGWFTTIVPTALRPPSAHDPGARLLAVKEQLRAIPGSGAGAGLLRELGSDPTLAALPAAQVSFNYLGRLDAALDGRPLLRPAVEDPGRLRAPDAHRPHLLEVVGVVEEGRLRVDWRHADAHDPRTVQQLAKVFEEELTALLERCAEPGAGGCCVADFPDAELDGAGLVELLAEFGLRPRGAGARAIVDVLPLSLQQQGMLLEALASTQAALHVEQVVLAVSGGLDVGALSDAWQGVVERHAALRCAFALRPSPLQVQFEHVELAVSVEACGDAAQQDWLEAWLQRDRARGFDALRPPLMRVAVLDLGGEQWRIVWTFHHAVLDGWSAAIVLRELLALYAARSAGREAALARAPSPRPYHRWLRARDLDAAERFWRLELEGAELPTPLGRTQQREPDAGAEFGQLDTELASDLSARLAELARARQLTLSTVVQGAWALLLARFGETRDVVFGTTVSGRPPQLPGIEDAVGLYINTLPFRVAVPAAGAFWEWLGELQRHHAEIREHDHAAGRVHAWAGFPGARPLYESVVVVENYPTDFGELGAQLGARVVDVSARGARTRHALALLVTTGERIALRLVHDGRRLDGAAAAGVLDALAAVLERVAADEHADLARLGSAIADEAVPAVTAADWERPAVPAEVVAPRTKLELELAELWEDLLELRGIGVRQNFFELGGHSLLALHLLDRISARFDVELQLAALVAGPTIEQLARVLDGVAPPAGSLVRLRDGGPGTPLFLVPGASGNPMAYLPLARQLGDERAFYGLMPPGLDGAGPMFTSVEQLAGVYADVVRAVQPDGPYLLAGHSFGGAVAFDMARQLVAAGAHVGLVAIADLARPRREIVLAPDRDDATWITDIVRALAAFLGRSIAVDVDELRGLPDERRHRFLLDELIAAHVLPPDAQLAIVPALLQAYRVSAVALAEYEAEPLDVPIVLLRPSEGLTRDDEDPATDRTLGWQEIVPRPVDVRRVAGGHITMIREPHVAELARALRECLDVADPLPVSAVRR